MGIIIPLLLIVISSLVIWKTTNGFEDAFSFLGRNLTDGVKGATINAISSSIPELLTSVPDTILSVKDAMKGNYNDAISNAIGSNVFDIGFVLGFPILMFSVLYFKDFIPA